MLLIRENKFRIMGRTKCIQMNGSVTSRKEPTKSKSTKV